MEEIAAELDQALANTYLQPAGHGPGRPLTTRLEGRNMAADHVAGMERLAPGYLGNRDGRVVDCDELAPA